jgi:hypothetical protein
MVLNACKKGVYYILCCKKTDWNVPTKDIIKWNILDAMWDHFVAWKSIMTAIIQNCLTKYGFSTAR